MRFNKKGGRWRRRKREEECCTPIMEWGDRILISFGMGKTVILLSEWKWFVNGQIFKKKNIYIREINKQKNLYDHINTCLNLSLFFLYKQKKKKKNYWNNYIKSKTQLLNLINSNIFGLMFQSKVVSYLCNILV